jgi:RNA polymerase sigma-70 factor, ECF subfamily
MRRSFPASSGLSPTEDESPAARLFQEHAPAIFAYLRLRTASREEAEDLLLEVFVAAVERAETLAERTGTAQRAWLRAVAAHKVADHYRRGYARPQISLEEVAETLFADETQTPEHTALQREQDDRLWTLLLTFV